MADYGLGGGICRLPVIPFFQALDDVCIDLEARRVLPMRTIASGSGKAL
ncbi:MAG: hypothetical protein OXE85_02470 [Roseovarius sp.]|nr:hypothetical protein [Roseovarius sp.]